MLCTPWRWARGTYSARVRQWFAENYAADATVCLFNSGRSALLGLCKAFGIGKGDEVILQAFTCVAVPNSVVWAGATPVYADIDASYNLDPADVERKITSNTRAIIVQHTFGIPADMERLAEIARAHHCMLIEDCAHAMGASYRGRRVGTIGDAAFFSFGRDKSISSVWGGAAMISHAYAKQGEKLKSYQKTLGMPKFAWIARQLLHPIAFSVILPLYRWGIGKVLLVMMQKLNLLSYPVYPEEKSGKRPADFPAAYPNALASLLVRQLPKVARFTAMRRNAAHAYATAWNRSTVPYQSDAAYLRYPIVVSEPKKLLAVAKKNGILLGNWYHNVIDPLGVDLRAVGYVSGSCPNAEDAARHVVNLPTRVPLTDVQRIIDLVTRYA